MPYFIISNSDGDTTIDMVDKETLEKRLQPVEKGSSSCYYGEVGFMGKIKSDTNYWGKNILIIKGEIVTPKPKKVIETYEID